MYVFDFIHAKNHTWETPRFHVPDKVGYYEDFARLSPYKKVQASCNGPWDLDEPVEKISVDSETYDAKNFEGVFET